MLRIREIPGSNFDSETGYPYLGISLFFWVFTSKF